MLRGLPSILKYPITTQLLTNYHPIPDQPPPTNTVSSSRRSGRTVPVRRTNTRVRRSMRHQHLLHHVRRVAAATGEPLQAVRLLHGTFRSPLPGARYVYFITHFNLTYGQLYRRRVLFVFTGTCIAAKNMRWFATFLMYAGVSQNHIQDPNTNTQLRTN